MATAHYSADLRRGFVVRHTTRSGLGGAAWWYGPGSGWGTTFGALDYGVAVFPSRRAAELAVGSGYNGASRLTIDTLSEARAIEQASRERRARAVAKAAAGVGLGRAEAARPA